HAIGMAWIYRRKGRVRVGPRMIKVGVHLAQTFPFWTTLPPLETCLPSHSGSSFSTARRTISATGTRNSRESSPTRAIICDEKRTETWFVNPLSFIALHRSADEYQAVKGFRLEFRFVRRLFSQSELEFRHPDSF